MLVPNTTSIDRLAFYYAIPMRTIVIPKGVTNIGEWAFWGCYNLRTITFLGTLAEWNAIEKGVYWDRNVVNCTVVCSDGTTTCGVKFP